MYPSFEFFFNYYFLIFFTPKQPTAVSVFRYDPSAAHDPHRGRDVDTNPRADRSNTEPRRRLCRPSCWAELAAVVRCFWKKIHHAFGPTNISMTAFPLVLASESSVKHTLRPSGSRRQFFFSFSFPSNVRG